MIDYTEVPGTNIAEIVIDGKVTKEDFDSIVPKLEKLIETHGNVRFLKIVKSFGGFEMSMLWDDMKFAFGNLKNFERVALVTDKSWIKSWTKMGKIFISAELNTYSFEQIKEAREWLKE